MSDRVLSLVREVKMPGTLPAPLVPAEVDLRDFDWTPIWRRRLFNSTFHAKATDSEWRAGVTLSLKSWDQVPAGTLPTDDIELCRLAELGRDLKEWERLKAGALRGWHECSDGRLYHAVVAEGVLEAWSRRRAASRKGKAGAAKRWGAGNAPATESDAPVNATGNAPAIAPAIAPANAPANASASAPAIAGAMPGDSYGPGPRHSPPNPLAGEGGSDQIAIGSKPERPSRAKGNTPRQQAQRAADEAEARQATERRAAADAQWLPRLEEFKNTGRWNARWGRPPSTNPAVTETGVFLPRWLWERYRAIVQAQVDKRETHARRGEGAGDPAKTQ